MRLPRPAETTEFSTIWNLHHETHSQDVWSFPFEELRMSDVDIVGGKNASLGEMISQLAATGVKVPGGFATTAEAFRDFLTHNRLTERHSNARLASLNTDDVKALAEAGAEIRGWVRDADFPPDLEKAIRDHFARLTEGAPEGISFAVRSSATAEDLPDASFAGQQETVLNVVASTPFSTTSARSLPRSTTTVPSPTASTRASPTRAWRCRPASSACAAPTSVPRA